MWAKRNLKAKAWGNRKVSPKRLKFEGTENEAENGRRSLKALKAKLKGEVREPNEAQKELCEGEAWTQSQNERSEIHCEDKRQAKRSQHEVCQLLQTASEASQHWIGKGPNEVCTDKSRTQGCKYTYVRPTLNVYILPTSGQASILRTNSHEYTSLKPTWEASAECFTF